MTSLTLLIKNYCFTGFHDNCVILNLGSWWVHGEILDILHLKFLSEGEVCVWVAIIEIYDSSESPLDAFDIIFIVLHFKLATCS